jgi:hypothetical protein
MWFEITSRWCGRQVSRWPPRSHSAVIEVIAAAPGWWTMLTSAIPRGNGCVQSASKRSRASTIGNRETKQGRGLFFFAARGKTKTVPVPVFLVPVYLASGLSAIPVNS